MKVIIAGFRTATVLDGHQIRDAIAASGYEVTELVSGNARGIDRLAEWWAEQHHIPITRFPPDYEKYSGSAAPRYRNTEMAKYADALIAIPGPQSTGTYDMVNKMKKVGKPIYVHKPAAKPEGIDRAKPDRGPN